MYTFRYPYTLVCSVGSVAKQRLTTFFLVTVKPPPTQGDIVFGACRPLVLNGKPFQNG